MAFFTETQTTTAGLADRFNAVVATYKEHRAKRKVYKQTFAELLSLSNRELADLGMSRANIRSVAHEAAYGNK